MQAEEGREAGENENNGGRFIGKISYLCSMLVVGCTLGWHRTYDCLNDRRETEILKRSIQRII